MTAPAPLPAVRMDHVGIDVGDLDAQIGFYVQAFDLEVEWRVDLPALGPGTVEKAAAAGLAGIGAAP